MSYEINKDTGLAVLYASDISMSTGTGNWKLFEFLFFQSKGIRSEFHDSHSADNNNYIKIIIGPQTIEVSSCAHALALNSDPEI